MRPEYLDKYPLLFTPMEVGRKKKVQFKNRILCSPTGGSVSQKYGDRVLSDEGVDFHTSFARGGFASITVPTKIPFETLDLGSLRLEDFGFAYMHRLQHSVHAFGCKTMFELYHQGICQVYSPDRDIIGASDMMYNGHKVRGMNEDDMEEVIQMYVKYAKLVKRGGFDGITLHYAHGWLMHNFLCPLSNFRKDKYGGSVENRCRFPRMVMEAVRKAIGDDMLIELRINGADKVEGGISPEDAAQQALIFEDLVDMIHVSCGTRLDAYSRPKMHPTGFVEDCHNAFLADIFKKAGVKVPVGSVGSMHDPVKTERLLEEGQIDYVMMCRQAIADRDYVNKIREGREEDIRPCLRCDVCVDGGRRGALTKEVNLQDNATFDLYCSVNPMFGTTIASMRAFRPTRHKFVAVIGGGIAGMQAALSAAEKGHDVVIYEKDSVLGGQTAFFPQHLWFKKQVVKFRDYMIRQVMKNPNIKVFLNTEAIPSVINAAGYDAVIVAVGAEQIVPPIPGVDGDNVTMAWDVFGHEEKFGKKVVIIGGGSVGCEIGISLGEKGRKVDIVEMAPFFAANQEITERMDLEIHLAKNNVNVLVNTQCLEIGKGYVKIKGEDGEVKTLDADDVIISVGSRAKAQLRDSFDGIAFDVIKVGECTGKGTIRTAVRTGWCAGNVI